MEFNRKQIMNLQSTITETKAERKFHEITINILNQRKFFLKRIEESIHGI